MDDASSVRRLKQRDRAWDAGDTLARAVDAYVDEKIDLTTLIEAIKTYRKNSGW